MTVAHLIPTAPSAPSYFKTGDWGKLSAVAGALLASGFLWYLIFTHPIFMLCFYAWMLALVLACALPGGRTSH